MAGHLWNTSVIMGKAAALRLHLDADIGGILGGASRHDTCHRDLVPDRGIGDEAELLLKDLRPGARQVARGEIQDEGLQDQHMRHIRQLCPVRLGRSEKRRRHFEAALP